MAERRRLVIIDGYSLLFRAFYGTRYLSTADGRPTNALFGLVSMLLTLFNEIKPDAVAVALDAPGKTFRHAQYAEYKGTRRETPQELISQLDVSRQLISDLTIPVMELTGYEADDIVGTISRLAEENGYDTTIVTGDLDSLQLVDDHVSVMTTLRGVTETIIYTPEKVRERYGFGPEHITDYKALVGDTSDNIKGVPGIGDKSATALIQQFGTVEQMLERFDEVDEKYRKKIEPNIDQMVESKWLATIVRDAPVEYDFAPYRIDQQHLEKAKEALVALEFRTHTKRLEAALSRYLNGAGEPSPIAEIVSEAVTAKVRAGTLSLEELVGFVANAPYALHFSKPSGQQSMFEDAATREAFVAVGNEVARTSIDTAAALFERAPERLIGHDVKHLYRGRKSLLAAPRFDTMLAGYVLQSGRSSYDLPDLVQGYLDHKPSEKPEDQAASLIELERVMRDRLNLESQSKVLDEIELPLVPVLAEMEDYGISVSREFLLEYSQGLQTAIDQSQAKVYELAGMEFNIGSPKQIGEVLFEKLQIPGGKKTKTGYATGAEVLQELAPTYPVAGEIINYRELTKLKGTYADALPKMIADDGRVHTSFNQAVAATGRLSSNDPNLQNIPVRTELGRQIRKAFVAAPGFRLGSFDYSQIELRILAHMCHDQALVDAFQKRVDVHTVTASLMFGVDQAQVTKEQRRLAKMLNYAVLYGVTDFGLANQLGAGFSVTEAKELIKQYNERFPAVKAFTESVVEEARAKGFTATLCGRRRYFADIHAGNRMMRLYAERQAINAPIQGTAADMIKLAMLEVRKLLGQSKTRMLLQVHDELVFEMADDGDGLISPVREKMEQALPLEVPVEVDAKVGANWLEMQPVG